MASAKNLSEFANSIPEIVAGFEKTADQLSETLLKAFAKLKEIAQTGAGIYEYYRHEAEKKA